MRHEIAYVLLSLSVAVAIAVATMTWHALPLAYGILILAACAVTFAIGIILLIPWQKLFNKSASTFPAPQPSQAARLLVVAKALREEIVAGRARVAKSRFERGDAKMMVEMIDRERIRSPDLMSANKNTLSLRHAEILSRYQDRERELEMCIDGIEKRQDEHRRNPQPAARDFLNRLNSLSVALNRLIDSLTH